MRSWLRFNTLTCCVVTCLLGVMDSPQKVLGAIATPGRRLAIVIGVNTYRPNSGLGPLQHAVKDANRLSTVLRKSGYTVIEMTHDVAREPGKEVLAPYLTNIRDQMSGILGTPNLGKKDSVLITLHGHGVHFDLHETVSLDGKQLDQKTPKFYFCPADASIREIKSANDLSDKNYLLPLDELYAALGSCKAATKLLIVDACRNDPSQSGVFREGEVRSQTMPKIPPPPGGLAAFLSCRESQRAVEDKDLGQGGQGVFTHFLIRGLEGKADQSLDDGQPADGIITLSELTTYTANNTYAYVYKKYPGVQQSPEIKGEFDANLAIVRLSVEDPDYVRGVALILGLGTRIDRPAGIALLRQAADRDHPLAMGQLAFLNHAGSLIPKNVDEATRLAERSRPRLEELAQAGNSEAQDVLGNFFNMGIGCQQDLRLAVSWYRKAAEQNLARAQLHLGQMYESGKGVSTDPTEAVKWYRMAAEQNNSFAQVQCSLGGMYERGEGVVKDPTEAVKWYRRAAEQDYPEAQSLLGFMYQQGKGVTKDPVEAVKWLRMAAERNNAVAQNNLGVMYSNGAGLAKDDDEAVKWYRKAAEQNYVLAQYNLGLKYRDGEGVVKDAVEAEGWFRKVLSNPSATAAVSKQTRNALKEMGKSP